MSIASSAEKKLDFHSIPLPTPKVPHKIVTPEQVKPRLIIVGDVHGCLDELQLLLFKAEYDPKDSDVLLLGDLVNKGPYSAEVVQFARKKNLLCIRGNHDDFALRFALGLVPQSERPSALSYLDKLSSEDVEWLKELPYSISFPHWRVLCIHAGLVPGLTLDHQSAVDMTTIRNVYTEEVDNNRLVGTAKGSLGEPWVDAYNKHFLSPVHSSDSGSNSSSIYHVYFGHDAKRGLQLTPLATGLDSGCAYGKKLSAMVLPSKELIQVDAKQTYQAIVEKD